MDISSWFSWRFLFRIPLALFVRSRQISTKLFPSRNNRGYNRRGVSERITAAIRNTARKRSALITSETVRDAKNTSGFPSVDPLDLAPTDRTVFIGSVKSRRGVARAPFCAPFAQRRGGSAASISLLAEKLWVFIKHGRGAESRRAHAVGHKKKLGYAHAKKGIYVSDIARVARRGVLQSRSLGIYTPRER